MKEYSVKNLILGEFKDSYSKERIFVEDILGKKSIISMPNSIEADLADAFLATKQAENKFNELPIKELINIIKKVGKNYLNDEKKIKLISLTTGSPISYVKSSLNSIKEWMINIDKFIETVFGSIDNLENGLPVKIENKEISKIFYKPGGIISIVLAGDEVALSTYVITQSLLSRNPTVVKPSTIELISCNELIQEFAKNGLKDFIQLVCWNAQLRPELIKELIKNGKQVVLFGNDNTVNNFIYEKDANGAVINDFSQSRKIIKFTSGRSAAIVMEDCDLKLAVDEILYGATMNRGIECINTKKVYLHEKIYEEFIKLLKLNAKNLKLGKPLDNKTAISHIDKNNLKKIKSLCNEAQVIFSSFNKDFMGLLAIEDNSNNSRFVKEEIPGPVIAIIKISSIDDAIKKANLALNNTSFATTTSLFTKNNNYIKKSAINLKTYKLNINKSSTFMDFFVMHDGKYLVKELLDEKVLSNY